MNRIAAATANRYKLKRRKKPKNKLNKKLNRKIGIPAAARVIIRGNRIIKKNIQEIVFEEHSNQGIESTVLQSFTIMI